MYEDILVPTDGSRAADAAIEHAVTLADRFDATLHALYVVDSTAYSSLDAGSQIVSEALGREGEDAVDRIAASGTDADVPVVESVVSGTPFRSILEYADREGIDLITMGTHGRTGIDRYLLGSVSERVVRSANQPVLTVRLREDEEGSAPE
ncbi:universal stress protein [Halorarum halobium]|uniref:universal stress protein n=1 Tax=Halorarum halobium TaxID=3075121 RepID=UPI0028AC0362|nr:universal stress protein [Halobaculum sp. XH14]